MYLGRNTSDNAPLTYEEKCFLESSFNEGAPQTIHHGNLFDFRVPLAVPVSNRDVI